jgi:hypothetical protein
VKLKLYIGTLYIIFIITPLLVAGQGVILPSGIYMKLSDGTMVLHGNWVNNGNFSDDNGTLVINGTTNVKGSSANMFGNLTKQERLHLFIIRTMSLLLYNATSVVQLKHGILFLRL